MRALRVILAFTAAVLVTTLLGSVFQTQFNLAALQALGTPVPPGARLQTTAHDLLGFTPNFGPIVAAGFLVAFVAAALLVRRLPQWRSSLYALAGATAVVAAMLIMNAVFGLTPVAAARTLAGLTSLALAGAIGGWAFDALTRGSPAAGQRASRA